ncbi:MAG: DUF3455 domain-containing protein [Candidatus Sulfotelmatobacter sp.]
MKETKRRFLLVAVLIVGAIILTGDLGLAQSNPPKEAPPDVPDAIAVPAGLEPVLFAHGSGSQIYSCQAGADGKFAWTLTGPDAELKDRNDKVIGQHSADPASKLPMWKLKDGSEVTGKAAAHVNSLDETSVPWLLINVVINAGKGSLAKVTTIQRVHTHGGQPPDYGCDESHKNDETKNKYTADYYFFAPAK